MICKVISVEEQVIPNSSRKVVVVLIADESGCVNLRLIDDQSAGLKENQIIEVRNCRVNVVAERIRLEIDPWGKIIHETSLGLGEVNTSNNKSNQIFRIVEEEED